jgi:glycosyltransferase involved in cell wall biosynthesis
MKILFTWHAAVESEYRKLFKEIAKKGHELIVICPRAWTEGGRLQRVDNLKEACSEQSESNGYSLFSFPVIFRDRIKRFFYLKPYSLYKLFSEFKPDIVHIFEEPYSLVCLQMIGLTKIASPLSKIVVQSFENINIAQKFPFSNIEDYVLKNTNLLIAIPKEGESVWKGKGYSKTIEYIPVGLDENIFKKTDNLISNYSFLNKRNKVRIGYVGRLTVEKGLSILFEAVSDLLKSSLINTFRDKPLDFELLIIGSGDKDKFKKIADGFGIADRVVFLDAIPNYQLPDIYSKIDIMVLPSMTTDRWKEQFGRVLIEAMACGVAVVGSSSGEIPNIIGEAGFIFQEGNLSALSKILKELVSDSNLREKTGKRGRNRVLQKFTWSSITERLCSIYQDIK